MIVNKKSAALLIAAMLAAGTAFAGSSNGLAFVDTLTKFSETMSGPFAKAVGLLGLIAIGAVMVFGGELSDFVKRLVYVVGAIAIMIGGSSILNFVGGGGLEVPPMDPDQLSAVAGLLNGAQ